VVDRLVVMDGGFVVQEGSPQEVIANPANSFVAAFRRTTGMPPGHNTDNAGLT